MASIRDAILAALDRKTTPISIPEWNVDCYIRTWTAGEKNNFLGNFSGVTKDNGKLFTLNMDAKAVVLSLSDESGTPVLTDADLQVLLNKNATVIDRISKACMAFNGMGLEQDIEKK